MDREPLEPASADESIQAFLDSRWRGAISSVRQSMENLREVVPELAAHLPEPGYNHLSSALDASERAYASLHKAGAFVLGQTEYDQFLEAQTKRRVG